jgi:Cof subfamily protein (haloacid dehalogenase superfamily)
VKPHAPEMNAPIDIRLIAIDIDGTLLGSRGRIPDENIAAIDEALAAGLHVVLVTGRSFPFARAVAGGLPASISLIVSNGAIERTLDGRTIARRLLPREAAGRVLARTMRFRQASAILFDREAEGHVVAESMDWDHPYRRGYWERHRHFIGHAAPLEVALTEDPIQVMFNGDVATMRDVFAAVQGTEGVFVSRTEYESRDFSLVDVTAPDATKGHALAWRAAQLGVSARQVMAIGDNLNDLEMLQFAGVPVVMGNAVEALRDRGWHETATHDEAGVARAIRTLALENGRAG